MQLQKLFENLAKKAGIDINDAEFKTALESIKDVQLKDEIASDMEAKLFDIETAKSNYTLKSHFTALGLNGVDSELKNTLDELLAENEDVRNELYNEKSTPKRVVAAIRKIKELESIKAKADSKGDDGKAAKAQEQIDKLVSDFKVKETTYQQQLLDKEREKNEAITSLKEDIFYSGLKFANDFDLEINQLNAKQKINKALMEKGAKTVYNHTTGKFELKSANDETLDYLDESNNKPSYEDFAKGVLTQNKLLAVSDPSAGKTPLTNQQQQTNNSADNVDYSRFDAAFQQS